MMNPKCIEMDCKNDARRVVDNKHEAQLSPGWFGLRCEGCEEDGKVKELAPDEMTMTIVCKECQDVHLISVTNAQLEARGAGGMVHEVFPNLSAGQRELLVSGTCGDCFDVLYAEFEDDYYN